MDTVLGILALANLLYIWRSYRATKRVQKREKELLEDCERWESQKSGEVKALAAYRDGGSWVISDASKSTADYYVEAWKN